MTEIHERVSELVADAKARHRLHGLGWQGIEVRREGVGVEIRARGALGSSRPLRLYDIETAQDLAAALAAVASGEVDEVIA